MLEWYRMGGDYFDLMEDCRRLVFCCVEEICMSAGRRGESVPSLCAKTSCGLSGSWPKITVAEAFARWSPLGLETCLHQGLFDEMLVEHVEPHLGSGDVPCFLYDYPDSMASLARKKPGGAGLAERFELYWKGLELANGFSELTDAGEQRRRFENELRAIGRQRGEDWSMPEKFLQDLDQLGECAGIAFGVDRFFMLLLGKDDIAEAVTFGPDDL